MAEDSAQEKTEEPTARKLSKAREEGQVARSTELPAAAIVIGAFLMILAIGGWLITRIADNFAKGFVFDRKTLDQPLLLPTAFFDQVMSSFWLIAPIMLLTAVLAVIAAGMTGGYLFSLKAVAPKASKLSLVQGFKRMFGTHAATELLKAIIKFTLVSGVLWLSIASEFDTLLQLGRMGLEPALAVGGELIAKSALWIALSLALIAFIDVPIQKSQFTKRMRMTKQEIKDEMKDIEGRPEVKAQIRRRQREMANGRMMQRVKDADVIITNPEHFAVALEYDPSSDRRTDSGRGRYPWGAHLLGTPSGPCLVLHHRGRRAHQRSALPRRGAGHCLRVQPGGGPARPWWCGQTTTQGAAEHALRYQWTGTNRDRLMPVKWLDSLKC